MISSTESGPCEPRGKYVIKRFEVSGESKKCVCSSQEIIAILVASGLPKRLVCVCVCVCLSLNTEVWDSVEIRTQK